MRIAAVALLLMLAACGGGSTAPTTEPTVTKTATAKATATATSKAPTKAPQGKPVPEALSQFRCEQNSKGTWNASGFVANAGKAKVTFQVTVYVGTATGGEERAKTRQVPHVAAGGSAAFKINKLPAPEEGGTCHVQVLATK